MSFLEPYDWICGNFNHTIIKLYKREIDKQTRMHLYNILYYNIL